MSETEQLFDKFCHAQASFESSRHIYRRDHQPGLGVAQVILISHLVITRKPSSDRRSMLEKLKKMLLATKILLSFERHTGQIITAKPPRPLSPAPAK
jgi:hypothetical protein